MSAEGKVFYINHHNKTTHWTRPDPPPVQPSNPPAEDLPIYGAAAAVHERLGRASPLADRSLSPLPADGSDGAGDSPVSSVSDLDAVPFGLGESFVKEARAAAAELEAQEGDGVVALKEELPKASTGAEFESVHVEEVDGSSVEAGVGGAAGGPQYGYFKRGFEGELSKGTAEGDGAVGTGLLEEVEGAPDSGTGVQLGDPKRAPSATVVAAAAVPGAAEEEESTFRSMGASPANAAERSAAAAATAAGANTSARAAGSNAPDDGSAGGGGPGPVSSIVKSGLYGATVSRPNSPVRKGTGGSDSPMAARGTSSSAPIYASSAGNIAVAAAAAAAVEEESEPESEEAPLPEGIAHVCTRQGSVALLFRRVIVVVDDLVSVVQRSHTLCVALGTAVVCLGHQVEAAFLRWLFINQLILLYFKVPGRGMVGTGWNIVVKQECVEKNVSWIAAERASRRPSPRKRTPLATPKHLEGFLEPTVGFAISSSTAVTHADLAVYFPDMQIPWCVYCCHPISPGPQVYTYTSRRVWVHQSGPHRQDFVSHFFSTRFLSNVPPLTVCTYVCI